MIIYWIGVAVAAIILGRIMSAAPDNLLAERDVGHYLGEAVIVVVGALAWPLTLLAVIVGTTMDRAAR